MTKPRLSKTIQVRLEYEDNFELSGEADEAGISKSALMRRLIMADLKDPNTQRGRLYNPDQVFFVHLARVMAYTIDSSVGELSGYEKSIAELAVEIKNLLGDP